MVDNTPAGARRGHGAGSPAGARWPRTIRLIGVLALAFGSAGMLAAPAAAQPTRPTASPTPVQARPQPGLSPRLWRPGTLRGGDGLPATSPSRAPSGTWTVQPTPNPPRPNGILLADSCTSPAACTAVGSRFNGAGVTVTLAERWNGRSWRIQATPDPAGATYATLTGVSCVSARSCTGAGYYYARNGSIRTLAEHWDGTRWRIQPTPNPAQAGASGFFGVSCTSAVACTATGDYHIALAPSKTLTERWNGRSWRIQATPNPAGAQNSGFFGVSCTTASACTAAGSYVNRSGTTVTLAAAWNGTAWRIQATPNPTGVTGTEFLGVSCSAPNGCTAVGSSSTSAGTGQSVAERWNGTRWRIETIPSPAGPAIHSGGASTELLAVSCRAARSCTAAGAFDTATGTATLAESWNGTSWHVQATPSPAGNSGSGFSGVSCVSARSCTAVGSYSRVASTVQVTLAEAWNGTRWSVVTSPNPAGAAEGGFRAVSCVSARSCTAVGNYAQGTSATVTLAEAWDGTRWRIQGTPNPAHTTDAELLGVSCTSARSCTAVGFAYNGQQQRVLAERWNGRNWSIQATPVPSGAADSELEGVACPSAQDCTAVGQYNASGAQSQALAERWNGRRWRLEAISIPSGATTSGLTGVSCASLRTCTAVGSYSAGGNTRALAEAWNGRSWRTQHVPGPAGAQAVAFDGVSCSSPRACTAVGLYFTRTAGPLTLAERWNGTSWRPEATPNTSGAERNELTGVSCASASSCTAVGDYAANDNTPPTAFAETWNGSRWRLERAPGPPGTTASTLYGVSCIRGACTATGYHYGLSGFSVTLAEAISR